MKRISKLASKKWPKTSTQDRRNVALGLSDSFLAKPSSPKKNHTPQVACTHFVDLIYFEKHRWNQLKNPLKYGNVLQAYGKVVPLVTIGGFSEKSRTNISHLENSKIIFKKQNWGENPVRFIAHNTSIVTAAKTNSITPEKRHLEKEIPLPSLVHSWIFQEYNWPVLKDWPVRREPSHCNLITKLPVCNKIHRKQRVCPSKMMRLDF